MSNSSNNAEYINYLKYVTKAVVYYPTLITLPIGIIGNLFSIYIYSRPNLKKRTNTGFLYACFCFLNIILILYFSFLFRPQYTFGYNLNLPCGMPNYLLRVIWSTITWTLVFISFDRFVAVVFPLHKQIMRKKWLIALVFLGIFTFAAVANISNLLQTPGIGSSVNCLQSDASTLATSILATTSRIYIPFVIMLTFNSIVIHRLRQSRIRVRDLTTDVAQSSRFSKREYKLFVATICMDIAFFLFNSPLATFITIWSVLKVRGLIFDEIVSTKIFLFYSAAQMVTLMYSVFSFFIFALFNKSFRNEAVVVLGFKKSNNSN